LTRCSESWIACLLVLSVVGAAAAQTAGSPPAGPNATVVADSVSAPGDPGPTIDPVPAAAPFGIGEKFVFSIDFGPINAGEASLEIKNVVDSDGYPCYLIESRATSNRFFSAFYKVRDKVISHIDVYSLFSRYFSKRLREGTYRKTVAYRFDQDNLKVYYADGREFDIMPDSHDILSAFYFVRSLELVPGKDSWINTHSSRKNYELRVIVHGRDRVKVPAGEFDCLVVEPVLEGEGLFKQEGELTVWLTDDHRRMPVLMKSKVKVGSVDASLKEYQPGRPLGPEDFPEGLN
jgi:hypothetical protein